MSKKLMLGALSAVLPVATFVVAIGVGSASGKVRPHSPVTFVGNLSCNLQGTLTVSPAAFNGVGSGPWTVTFTGKNNHCKGLPYTTSSGTTATTPLSQGGETLKKSTESFSYSVSGSGALGLLCSDFEHGGPIATPIGFGITWLGTSPITGTQLNYPNGGTQYPGLIALINGSAGGSFTGTADVLLGYNLVTVNTDCASAAGLSTLAINHLGGDNLMVGPAF